MWVHISRKIFNLIKFHQPPLTTFKTTHIFDSYICIPVVIVQNFCFNQPVIHWCSTNILRPPLHDWKIQGNIITVISSSLCSSSTRNSSVEHWADQSCSDVLRCFHCVMCVKAKEETASSCIVKGLLCRPCFLCVLTINPLPHTEQKKKQETKQQQLKISPHLLTVSYILTLCLQLRGTPSARQLGSTYSCRTNWTLPPASWMQATLTRRPTHRVSASLSHSLTPSAAHICCSQEVFLLQNCKTMQLYWH